MKKTIGCCYSVWELVVVKNSWNVSIIQAKFITDVKKWIQKLLQAKKLVKWLMNQFHGILFGYFLLLYDTFWLNTHTDKTQFFWKFFHLFFLETKNCFVFCWFFIVFFLIFNLFLIITGTHHCSFESGLLWYATSLILTKQRLFHFVHHGWPKVTAKARHLMGVGFEFPNIATDENLWKIPANWDAVSDRTQGQQNPVIIFFIYISKKCDFLNFIFGRITCTWSATRKVNCTFIL